MTRISFILLLAALLCGSSFASFVRRNGRHFSLDGNNFYYAGCNAYWHGFETAKGVYNEEQFQLFDYVMKSAKDHGILVIITLENYWKDYGGIDSRLRWEGLPGDSHTNRAKFYTNSGCKTSYKNYVAHFVSRKNTVTGLSYTDDPNIFAWELMNEPRYQDSGENESGKTLRRWVDEMAAFIKQLDKNHMVGVGIEGHGSRYGYAGDEGNPFLYIHKSPFVDFTTGHMYPDESWANLTPAQTANVVLHWITDSIECNKPFVLEEFNSHKKKEEYWQAMLRTMENMGGAGDNFWNFMAKEESSSDFDIWQGHPIIDPVFKPHAAKMNKKH